MIRSHQSSVISHVAALLRDRTRCTHLISLFCSSPDDNRDTRTSNAPPRCSRARPARLAIASPSRLAGPPGT